MKYNNNKQSEIEKLIDEARQLNKIIYRNIK